MLLAALDIVFAWSSVPTLLHSWVVEYFFYWSCLSWDLGIQFPNGLGNAHKYSETNQKETFLSDHWSTACIQAGFATKRNISPFPTLENLHIVQWMDHFPSIDRSCVPFVMGKKCERWQSAKLIRAQIEEMTCNWVPNECLLSVIFGLGEFVGSGLAWIDLWLWEQAFFQGYEVPLVCQKKRGACKFHRSLAPNLARRRREPSDGRAFHLESFLPEEELNLVLFWLGLFTNLWLDS